MDAVRGYPRYFQQSLEIIFCSLVQEIIEMITERQAEEFHETDKSPKLDACRSARKLCFHL